MKQSKKPKPVDEQLRQNALEAVAFRELLLEVFDAICQEIHRDIGASTQELQRMYEQPMLVLRSHLLSKLHLSYTYLFMWGNLLGEGAKEAAQKVALEKFLGERYSIAHLLEHGLRMPGVSSTSQEENLRSILNRIKTSLETPKMKPTDE